MTPARVLVQPDPAALAEAAAARLIVALQDAQSLRDEVHVVATGGSLGSAIWKRVAACPARVAVDWSSVHLWWGDERYLPDAAPDRNDTQNEQAGLAELGLVPGNVHRVAGPEASVDATASAAAYGQEIHDSVARPWDLVLLGMGPDGHVASLFPGHRAQLSTGLTVAVEDAPKLPPTRVSLTFECLNRAERVWFLVAGADKAAAVAHALAGVGPELSSAAQVHGSSETLWLLDVAATGALP